MIIIELETYGGGPEREFPHSFQGLREKAARQSSICRKPEIFWPDVWAQDSRYSRRYRGMAVSQ